MLLGLQADDLDSLSSIQHTEGTLFAVICPSDRNGDTYCVQ